MRVCSASGGGASFFHWGFVGWGCCGSQQKEINVGEEQWREWGWKVDFLRERCSVDCGGSWWISVDGIQCQCLCPWLALYAVYGTMGRYRDVDFVCRVGLLGGMFIGKLNENM